MCTQVDMMPWDGSCSRLSLDLRIRLTSSQFTFRVGGLGWIAFQEVEDCSIMVTDMRDGFQKGIAIETGD